MLLQARTVTVVALERLQTTENGNTYLECRTEDGLLAVWGERNAAWLREQSLPCETAIFCIPDQHDRRLLWVPERTQLLRCEGLPPQRKVS